MRRYAPVMGEKTPDNAARELLFTTTSEREAHARAVQALLARNASLRTNDELIAEELRIDPRFRDEWERTGLARAVAVGLVRYRAEHGLSEYALAERMGMKLAEVALLEAGDVNPTDDMLTHISTELGLVFTTELGGGVQRAGRGSRRRRGAGAGETRNPRPD
jgi:ribosome-binding protein aMBF1 (putative translation factor)